LEEAPLQLAAYFQPLEATPLALKPQKSPDLVALPPE